MNILEILKKFFNIFKKNKKEIKKEEIIKNKDEEKDLLETTEPTNDDKSDYEKVEILDFIWAKRYKTEEELKNFPEGHEEGPFLVIGKRDGVLLCFVGKSSFIKKRDYTYLEIKRGEYGASKDTRYDLREIVSINEYQFIRNLDKLDELDKEKLYKNINILKNRNYYINKYNLNFPNISLKAGDIIGYERKNYLICEITEKDYICLELSTNDYSKENKKIHDLYINFNRHKLINKNEDFKLINYISNEVLLSILKKVKEIEEKKSKINIIQRGSVIVYENKYYFVYGEEGNDWLAFEIYNNQIGSEIDINVYKHIFHTIFDKEIKINKKDNAKSICLATEHQIEAIKRIRKQYKNNIKKEDLKEINLPLPKLQSGVMVKNSMDNKNYYIIEYNNFLSSCISEEDFKNKSRNVMNILSNNLTVISPEIIEDIRNITLDFDSEINRRCKK